MIYFAMMLLTSRNIIYFLNNTSSQINITGTDSALIIQEPCIKCGQWCTTMVRSNIQCKITNMNWRIGDSILEYEEEALNATKLIYK